MGVIALPNIAPKGPGARIDWELRSNTARFISPLTGYTRTLERPGGHFAATLRYENLNSANAARMRAFLSACRGQAQRFYLRDFGYTQRGSFPATELLTNNTFANGTTGWTAVGTGTLTAADGFIRLTQLGHQVNPQLRQNTIAVTQYAPYVCRGLALHGRGSSQLYTAFLEDGLTSANSLSVGAGMLTAVLVASSANMNFVPVYQNGSVGIAGDYFQVGYSSGARCALVDNGPNELLRSDEIDNAAWTKTGTTVTADYYTAPDGTVTGDRLIEDTSTGEHYTLQTVTRTNAVDSWCFAVALAAGDVGGLRNRARLRILDSGSTNSIVAEFDLLNGVISAAAAAGGSAANARAFMAPLGGGWFYCCIVGRMPASDTQIRPVINLLENPGNGNYTGTSSRNIAVWRATLAKSHAPVRLRQTTTAASASGTSQTGSALHLKGLPASTNGLLLADDLAEIITPSGSQFVRALNSLNSDAAGLGYFQFEPPLRESPVDNAGVIIGTPLMRAMLDDRTVRWSQRHAGFVDLEFTAVEDMTA